MYKRQPTATRTSIAFYRAATQPAEADLASLTLTFARYVGAQGAQGPQGSFRVELFRSTTTTATPAIPIATYNFTTDTLENISSPWTEDFGSLAQDSVGLWVSFATADPAANNGAGSLSAWSTPHMAGAQGPQGPAGRDGRDGRDGSDGATGPAGPQGPAGSNGTDGAAGTPGQPGARGPQGDTGPQGPQGETLLRWYRRGSTTPAGITLPPTGAVNTNTANWNQNPTLLLELEITFILQVLSSILVIILSLLLQPL